MGFLDDVLEEVKPEENAGEENAEEQGTGKSGEAGTEGKKRMHSYSPQFEEKFGKRKD